VAADFSFLKKLARPSFSLSFLKAKPSRVIGLHIGGYSSKVVQLRHERERAVLETYGELLNEGYLKRREAAGGGGMLQFLDQDIGTLVKDLVRESNVTTVEAICTVPTTAAFITPISFPRALEREIPQAVPYEARKYVPIPIAEVVLEWMILEEAEAKEEIAVLLVAVPREIVEKFRRMAEIAGLNLRALEVECFSTVRSLIGQDMSPFGIINLGHQSTTVTFADRGIVRSVHTLSRGSQELTRALERGLGVGSERAEAMKRDTGLSERIEDGEIVSIIAPLAETLFAEIARLVSLYNRGAPRKVQRLNLTGGGAHLKGIVEFAASNLGLEVTRGNPFSRLVTPPVFSTILTEIGPNFSTAIGAALREISMR
jgi:type IV pilus assembly protein PilM